MSVIIKGMNVPKCCGNCKYNSSSCFCSITHSRIDRDYEYSERLNDCPIKPVEELPKEKTGHWIDDGYKTESDFIYGYRTYKCSCCSEEGIRHIKTDYCPNCGAKMEVENDG